MSTTNLRHIFRPASVALVGASARDGSLGHAVLANIKSIDNHPPLYLVNPRHQKIGDDICYPRLAALPQTPSLAVIAVPRQQVIATVEECVALKIPAAIVITADAQHGEASLKARLQKLAADTGIRIVGPNCLGVISTPGHLNASFAAHPVAAGNLALISQSGAITVAMLAWAAERKIGFSGLVSIGDMADVDFDDLLDWFGQDVSTKAILLYVEAISDAKRFMSAARAAARVKPVIVIKSGRSQRAAQAAATHTGALAGADDVYDAAFRRAGLLRVDGIEELFQAAETLGRISPFPGDRLAIVTNGGGLGVLSVDDLEAAGGVLAKLSDETIGALDKVLPESWSHGNPADIIGDAGAERYRAALGPVLRDKNCDAVLVIYCPTALSKAEEAAQAVVEEVEATRKATFENKPVFALWLGGSEKTNEIFSRARIPHFETGAIEGFMHSVDWRRSRDALMAMPQPSRDQGSYDPAPLRRAIDAALARGEKWLSPMDITQGLQACGIHIAEVLFAADGKSAVKLSEPLIAEHGACVVKILSRDIVHKSDVGGVVLNLRTPESVARATDEILGRARQKTPDAKIDGVTLHPMIGRTHGRELIAGIAEDPTFGPIILFGQGGKSVEVVRDRAIGLPPLDTSLARSLIERTQVSKLLNAYRDEPAADKDAIADTLIRLAHISADIPQIISLDLNPLIADESGVIVLDARIQIAQAQPLTRYGANPRLAIAPYPKALETHVNLNDGTKLFVRPVRPEDEALYPRFFAGVTSEDLRLRFFAPVREFSHQFIARFTQNDYARAYAMAAIDKTNGDIAGVVRLMQDAEGVSGEYAILLRSDFKGRGLGWQLMQMVIQYARDEGLREVTAQVLPENHGMLKMCADLGFSISNDPEDHSLRFVRLTL